MPQSYWEKMGRTSKEYTQGELARGFQSIAHDVDDLRQEILTLLNGYPTLASVGNLLEDSQKQLKKSVTKLEKAVKLLEKGQNPNGPVHKD